MLFTSILCCIFNVNFLWLYPPLRGFKDHSIHNTPCHTSKVRCALQFGHSHSWIPTTCLVNESNSDCYVSICIQQYEVIETVWMNCRRLSSSTCRFRVVTVVVVVVVVAFVVIFAAIVLRIFSMGFSFFVHAQTENTLYSSWSMEASRVSMSSWGAFAWSMVPSQTAFVQLASLVVQPCEVRDMFSRKEVL